MKTITLTDKQFDSIFDFIDSKLESVLEYELHNPEILEEWEDLIEVYDIIEDIKVQHEKKLQAARAKQPKNLLLK